MFKCRFDIVCKRLWWHAVSRWLLVIRRAPGWHSILDRQHDSAPKYATSEMAEAQGSAGVAQQGTQTRDQGNLTLSWAVRSLQSALQDMLSHSRPHGANDISSVVFSI